jgi:hypothetical protein
MMKILSMEKYEMKFKLLCTALFILVLMVICCINADRFSIKRPFPDSVTVDMHFSVRDFKNDAPIENARVVIIDDGKVVGIAASDKLGNARKAITVKTDRKYINLKYYGTDNLLVRGSATVIVYCEGYLETIHYNVGVAIQSLYQPIYMKSVTYGGRNEPDEQLGNNHHLDTCQLAEKYSKYAGKKVEY